jgi:hypothetical protein
MNQKLKNKKPLNLCVLRVKRQSGREDLNLRPSDPRNECPNFVHRVGGRLKKGKNALQRLFSRLKRLFYFHPFPSKGTWKNPFFRKIIHFSVLVLAKSHPKPIRVYLPVFDCQNTGEIYVFDFIDVLYEIDVNDVFWRRFKALQSANKFSGSIRISL